jgi:hypothetical protein
MLLPIVAEAAFDRAYISAYVLDTVDQEPLKGVKMVARFEDDIGWRAWTEEANPDIVHGRTDINGFCRLNGRTNCGKSSCWIEEAPDGYYKPLHGGGGMVKYDSRSLLGVWQPDNVVITLALQRVEHPIPLYVHRVILDRMRESIGGFDGINAVLRFDFIADDWLPPEGNGRHADMIVRTSYALRDKVKDGKYYTQIFYDFTNEIEFPGEGNGCVETVADRNCGIRIRVAPETGYVSRKTLRFGRRRKKTKVKGVWPDEYADSNDDRCYSFRIRSRFDESGNLIEAYYGKIYGDFRFKGTDKSGFTGINFLYYLNPTSLDRNLEWDMKNNLCTKPLRMDYESIGVRYREP